jgi:hypothetical protein
MKNRGMKIKHPKIRGEWVELRFMMRATPSTVMHTLLVFPQPLEGGGSENPSLRENSLRRPRERLAG